MRRGRGTLGDAAVVVTCSRRATSKFFSNHFFKEDSSVTDRSRTRISTSSIIVAAQIEFAIIGNIRVQAQKEVGKSQFTLSEQHWFTRTADFTIRHGFCRSRFATVCRFDRPYICPGPSQRNALLLLSRSWPVVAATSSLRCPLPKQIIGMAWSGTNCLMMATNLRLIGSCNLVEATCSRDDSSESPTWFRLSADAERGRLAHIW